MNGQQNYRTPPEFLAAVQRKFGIGDWGFDLACTTADCIARDGFTHDEGHDALELPWPHCPPDCASFCNPPFGKAGAFARVASESAHARPILLIPASVGSKWFAEHVDGQALVVFLRPRIVFLQPDGAPCPAGINRDCMLVCYGWAPGYHCADWREW